MLPGFDPVKVNTTAQPRSIKNSAMAPLFNKVVNQQILKNNTWSKISNGVTTPFLNMRKRGFEIVSGNLLVMEVECISPALVYYTLYIQPVETH